jgi:hypothetical protein
MTPHALGTDRVDEALRVVRALGAHRYIAGRVHLVHALALASVPDGTDDALLEAKTWAREVLSDPKIDASSRHESLWRRASDAELVAVLAAFWAPGSAAGHAQDALLDLLERHDLRPGSHEPFDESSEDDIHPVLVDAGWELLALSELDPVRHAGGIAAFGDALSFESARFEEETAIPREATLYELPAMGAVELLRGADPDGDLVEPLFVWAQGNETLLDYVLRGVRRAAKLRGDGA